MAYDTIITGGTVVNGNQQRKADVGIKGQKITAVGAGLARQANGRTRVIDARGRYVIPGALDVHVHLALPAEEGA